MNKFPLAVLFSSLIFLAACGGGGGGGGGIVAPSNTGPIFLPSDSNTVTSTVSDPVVYSTISELSVSGALRLTDGISQQISFTSNSSGIASFADSLATSGTASLDVTYDPSKNPTAYKLSTNKGLSLELQPYFFATDLSAVFRRTGAAPIGSESIDAATKDLSSNFVALANAFDLGWSYQTYGVWVSGFKEGAAGRAAAASFGSPTAALPTTGTATYSGYSNGAYIDSTGKSWITHATLSANADFAARSLAVSSSGTKGTGVIDLDTALSSPGRLDFSGTLTWSGTTNSLTGTLATSGSSLSGPGQARFFGPDGSGGPPEIGGTFFLSGSRVERYIGAFGAKR